MDACKSVSAVIEFFASSPSTSPDAGRVGESDTDEHSDNGGDGDDVDDEEMVKGDNCGESLAPAMASSHWSGDMISGVTGWGKRMEGTDV